VRERTAADCAVDFNWALSDNGYIVIKKELVMYAIFEVLTLIVACAAVVMVMNPGSLK